MQWVFEQSERGGKLIVVDPRRTETARAADLHLQLTPGTDLALANGLLYLAIEERLVDHDYIARAHGGLRRRAAHRARRVTRRTSSALTGVSLEQQLRDGAAARDAEQQHAAVGSRPRAAVEGRRHRARVHQPDARARQGRQAGQRLRLPHRPGQRPGRPRARPEGRPAARLPPHRERRAPRGARARVGRRCRATLPGKGKSAYELLDALGPEGGIRALLVFGSNVVVASPNARHIERKLASLDLLVVCDAFENETARPRTSSCRSRSGREEEGTMTNLEGRVILRRRVRAAPARREDRPRDPLRARRAPRRGRRAFASTSRRRCSTSCGARPPARKADYSGITYERIRREQGVFWPCPRRGAPRHAAPVRRALRPPRRQARFHRRARTAPRRSCPTREYPLYFTTGRYKEHYNSGAQTRQRGGARRREARAARADPPAPRRRAWASSTAARCASRAGAARWRSR